ncbi:hypothetical protein Lfu02_39890 [Longispora fulva]|uniref:FtsP/CotA-like multicopper oxidase with cupredoxin domain n=1 Tax=Longispora fulva TaxID=619741 RepID=A0A8J7GEL3_9ACTN|nr:multicopper oxidase family protein [Longispora fulva]MBG6136450.1 FtsP/CotA-like multicopper oxidase with cupredoxin domain [Longispora fulva]GIG59617.1 hypothetical protein Lfu02_39890 [Longispora fulva]
MPTDLLAVDLLLVIALAIVWPLTGWAVGTLGARGLAWTLIALGLLLIALRIVVVAVLYTSGWWFVQETVVLGLPLILVPAAATVLLTLPRLRSGADLAHPLVAGPVRVTGYAAFACLVVAFVVSYPVTPGRGLVVVALTALAAGWSLVRTIIRYRSPTRRSSPVSHVATLVVGVLALTGGLVVAYDASVLPDRLPMGTHGPVDLGGGRPADHAQGQAANVADIRGPRGDGPVRRFTLTARHATVRGVAALTYDGTVPGPELRVTQGDVVEVTLRNADVAEGVTIHWHGYDVPNGEDGVAGVTQQAVRPGAEFTYRFLASRAGTYWYHSHQDSDAQVRAGLYGILIVDPAPPTGLDLALAYHNFGQEDVLGAPQLLGDRSGPESRPVPAGTPVRLRLVNTDAATHDFTLTGTAARVAAFDGTEVHGPTDVPDPVVTVPGGGRADLTFTMPDHPVLLDVGNAAEDLGLLLGTGPTPAHTAGTRVDPLNYGTPAATPFGRDSHFDRHFTLVLDERLGFYDGRFDTVYTVNGQTFPDIPAQQVRYGELVKFTIVNRSVESHPIHPHGHHVLVLSRDGRPATGSPVWLDTLDIREGQIWEVALKADNPGIWMDHCHNLRHAATGMMFHLAYTGVTTSYEVGRTTGDHPE